MTHPSKDFFSKHQNGASGTIIRNQKKCKGNGQLIGLFLIIVALVVGAYFLFINPYRVDLHIGEDINQKHLLGESISVEGVLITSGDIVTYTHILETEKYGTLLLKSKTIPLNNYSNHLSGLVHIIGRIQTFHHNYPLVEVSMIGGDVQYSNGIADSESSAEDVLPGTYFPRAGIYFPPHFFDSYTFVGNNDGESIVIRNLENNHQVRIDFFKCTDHGNSNCKQLLKTFEGNTDRTIVNRRGIPFLKLTEVNSRFFHNENRWGYFINDADFSDVNKIQELVILPNENYIKDLVTLYGAKVCLGNNAGISSITSHQVIQDAKGLNLLLHGSGENIFECILELDLALPNKFRFVDLKITADPAGNVDTDTTIKPDSSIKLGETTKEDEISQKEKKSDFVGDTTRNPNMPQFPINKEKAMTYKSSRGAYIMSFPSSNISFSALSKDQNFDQVGVQCNYGIHVIKFADKEQLDANPAIIIYECSAKNGITLPGEQYLLKELGEKKFLIHVRDGAWLDFARNIDISAIE